MAIKFGAGKKATSAAAKPGKPAQAARGTSGAGQGASLIPSDWVSGGLLNDVDVTITDMTFVDDWDYNGNVQEPVLALRVTMQPDEGDEVIQHFSAGDLARWVPDPDNPKHVIPAENSSAKALNNNTNCAAFLGSLIENGFPTNVKGHEVSEFVDVFEGTYCHVMRIPQKKRSGLATDGKEKEVLVVTQILRLPWEQEGKKTVAKPNGKPAAAAEPEAEQEAGGEEVDQAIVEEAAGMVVEVIREKGGKVPASQLSVALLKHVSKSENRAAILAMVKDPEFLGMEGAPWAFDGKVLTAE